MDVCLKLGTGGGISSIRVTWIGLNGAALSDGYNTSFLPAVAIDHYKGYATLMRELVSHREYRHK